jgi:arginase family enzyme
MSEDGGAAEAPVLPGWAGISTLFGAPSASLAALPEADLIVAGVPFDATASSRPGAAEGPEAIRRASRTMAAIVDYSSDQEMTDMRTGKRFRYRRPRLFDGGDVPVYPTDPQRNYESVKRAAREVADAAETAIFLGGDHSVSFPLFSGVQESLVAAAPGSEVVYLQIDHHFDFGRTSAIHGPLYHGSNARRISELPSMGAERIVFLGVGDATLSDQLDELHGAGIVSCTELRERGAADAVAGLSDHLDGRTLYLSLDIDVLDGAQAPGTGHVTLGGLQVTELQDLLDELRRFRIVALDLVEVAPRYDPSGRTAQLAARLLFDHLFRTEAK